MWPHKIYMLGSKEMPAGNNLLTIGSRDSILVCLVSYYLKAAGRGLLIRKELEHRYEKETFTMGTLDILCYHRASTAIKT